MDCNIPMLLSFYSSYWSEQKAVIGEIILAIFPRALQQARKCPRAKWRIRLLRLPQSPFSLFLLSTCTSLASCYWHHITDSVVFAVTQEFSDSVFWVLLLSGTPLNGYTTRNLFLVLTATWPLCICRSTLITWTFSNASERNSSSCSPFWVTACVASRDCFVSNTSVLSFSYRFLSLFLSLFMYIVIGELYQLLISITSSSTQSPATNRASDTGVKPWSTQGKIKTPRASLSLLGSLSASFPQIRGYIPTMDAALNTPVKDVDGYKSAETSFFFFF